MPKDNCSKIIFEMLCESGKLNSLISVLRDGYFDRTLEGMKKELGIEYYLSEYENIGNVLCVISDYAENMHDALDKLAESLAS